MDEAVKTAPPLKRSKKKRRLISGLILLVIIAVAVKLIIGFVDGPANGTVTVGKAKTNPNAYSIDLTPTPYKGQSMSFDYPRGLKPVASNPLGGPDVEKASFKVKDVITWQLNIDVYTTAGQPLSSDSSYVIRKQHPEIYRESHQIFGGQSIDIMTDTSAGGFNKVAFLQNGGLRATVSLGGDDTSGTAPLQTSFNMVLSSWRWR